MKQIYNNKVNYYPNIKSTTPKQIDLGEIQKQNIKGWGYIDILNKIKNETDKKIRNNLKSQLPVITFNANFYPTKNVKDFVSHNGLLVADFDGMKNKDEFEKEKQRLINDKYTLMLFASPSGKGLKVIIKIEKTTPKGHKEIFTKYKDYIKSKFWDNTSQNINRLCFVSYDPSSYLNQKSQIFKGKEDTYFLDKLTKDCNEFSCLTFEKHFALNKLAYTWGGIQAGNDTGLSDNYVIEAIQSAIDNNTDILDHKAASKTLNIAFNDGKKRPLKKEDVFNQKSKIKKIEFPLEVFPPRVQLMMLEYNKTLNYNIDFMAASFMFCISTLCGNKYKMTVKQGWNTPPLFWFVALGLPGTIKSHPLKAFIKPLSIIDKMNEYKYRLEMKDYDPSKNTKKPIFKQTIIKDATLEAIHYVHDGNKRGLGLYKDELKGFFGDMNKYRKGSDMEFWLESFNNDDIIINRATKEHKYIENTFINIIGTMQPDVFKNIITGTENGIVDRFLYTNANHELKEETIDEMDPKIIKWYDDKIIKFSKTINYIDDKDTVFLKISKEISLMRIKYVNSLLKIQSSDNETQQLKNYISKVKTYVPRFALLMCLINHIFKKEELKITKENMSDATIICDYFINSARNIFEESEKDNAIKEEVNLMKGMSKKEKIITLHKNGNNNTKIANVLKTSKQYVGKIVNQSKQSKPK